ncbi:DNA primase [Halobium salinum]|uniref:DNA primase n=1 Tax=Halobium salinum TaxID=1364940 RepID=A0ABD5PFX3_9EURY|nr:DNA primase [Halobium salinum]
MNARHVVVAAVVTMMLTVAGGPTVVGAADDETSLGVAVEDGETGATLLTVTTDGSAVANATVAVSVVDSTGNGSGNESAYSGAGAYATDENGTVALPSPNETVTVDVTVTHGGETVTETVDLVPAEGELVVELGRHADGAATATVTADGAPVENATLTVAADGTYAGAGEYTTGANGNVTLPAPNETTAVTLSASAGNLTGETSATLYDGDLDVAVDGATAGEPTVRVSRNGTAVGGADVTVEAAGNYSGTGAYETGADGTVSLPTPAETLSVTVVAAADNETATTTVTVESTTDERMSFGMQVSSFVHGLLDDDPAGGIGQQVSTWVHENNPGNAKAKGHSKNGAGGPPEHAKGAEGNQGKSGNGNGQGAEKGPDHPGTGPGATKDGNGGADGASGADEDDETDGKNGKSGGERKNGNGKQRHGFGAVDLGSLVAA